MKTVTLPVLHCFRCVYSWVPAKPTVRMCPRCKSVRWDVPKVRRPPYPGGGQGIPEIIAPKRREIRALVRKYRYANPRVFGSVARGEATPGSDVDILVQHHGGGLLDLAGLSIDLSELLGRRVDVVPDDSLRWYAAPQILAEAVPL